MQKLILFMSFFITSVALGSTKQCYRFSEVAPKHIGNKFVGPQAPEGICFKYPTKATRYHPRTHARFYMVGKYSGVYIMGPLDFVKNPICEAPCVSLEGSHFRASIQINLLLNRDQTAILEDILNDTSYELIPMSREETEHYLDF